MNNYERGKLISELRKEAGYTQKQLADLLYVTDKAISKWERGICMPDSLLLTKLSTLLEVDIEHIISGNNLYSNEKWVGELYAYDIDYIVAGKPLIHYLLSYFMLVGVKEIYIKTDNEEFIRKLHLEKYGLVISFKPFINRKTIIIYDKFFLFGANITRQFQNYMVQEENVVVNLNNKTVPIVFSHKPKFSLEWNIKNSIEKKLGRGTILFNLNSEKQINDVSRFIEIYEEYNELKISDLSEIAKNRMLIV